MTPAMREARGWLCVLLHDNPEGAALHLLTSRSVFPARDPYHREYCTRPVEHRCLDLMLALTEDEQDTVLNSASPYAGPGDDDGKTDEMWEAEREWFHLPRHWQDSPTQVEVPFGRWWSTWVEPGEEVPDIPDWVSIEGWHGAAAEAAAKKA